jgi:hypothetical protein
MNDYYARILHDDRMAEFRREASGIQRGRSRLGPARLIAALSGGAHSLGARFTHRGGGPGTEETPLVREGRMPPARTGIGS